MGICSSKEKSQYPQLNYKQIAKKPTIDPTKCKTKVPAIKPTNTPPTSLANTYKSNLNQGTRNNDYMNEIFVFDPSANDHTTIGDPCPTSYDYGYNDIGGCDM